MATQVKSKRRDIRLSPEHDSVISAAAEKHSQSVSSFLVESALVRIETEMADRTQIVLSPADWDAFVAKLDAPPVINERLLSTLDRAKAVADSLV